MLKKSVRVGSEYVSYGYRAALLHIDILMYKGTMRILGIETSCDESGVCLIDASGMCGIDFKFDILGNALASQAALHAQYGGVFPNLAKREHAKALVPLLETALRDAGAASLRPHPATVPDLHTILMREPELQEQLEPFLKTYERPAIDAIAVTTGPGLEPALWVGINFARALAIAWDIPIVATNHMEGHIMLSIANETGLKPFEFPALALLISGGHTELVLMRAFGEYEIIGQTRDDAAGEAFDKVARLLGLPYPGGPEISRLAASARAHPRGDTSRIQLPRPMLREDNFDFSFSGLKTAVRRVVEAHQPLSNEMKLAIAREFEDAATEVIVSKTLRAAEHFCTPTIILGGGVSANTHIKDSFFAALQKDNLATLLTPPPALATDNALMIALAGYTHAVQKEFVEPHTLKAQGHVQLGLQR